MKKQENNSELMPLNKYLSNAGVCSRRDAVEFIKLGHVQVNGKAVKEPGYKVSQEDKVLFKGTVVRGERKVYILLNKPLDYITTVEDEEGRRSVIDLLRGGVKERVYPVGRLDRLTTGLLLLTNDGELAQNLSHPSSEVKKVYSVVLDQELKGQDLIDIKNGLTLKDGFIKPDRVYCDSKRNRKHVVIQIHSGKNRIVRRIFKERGYNVLKLDRINYAGIIKKGLPVGRWRVLKRDEVIALKKAGEIRNV